MNAEVITTGTELLLGQITDTNSIFIGKKLAEAGINLYYKTAVGDNVERVKQAIAIALDRCDAVIMTGGLGPTVDDVTRDAIAQLTGKKLIIDKATILKIENYFAMRNIKMPENNKVQAYIPDGALVIENKVGTAPGFIIEHNSKIIAAMPGVPDEMHPMMENTLIPYLIGKMGGKHMVIKSKVFKVVGMPESLVNEKIEDIFKESRNPTIALLAHQTEIDIRLTAKAEDEEKAGCMIDKLASEIYARVGGNIYGSDDETLESKVAALLKEKKLTISTAESCTAGLLSFRLTSIPGSSEYFAGGLSSYSNDIKTGVLGVKEEVITRFGAVSEESAIGMAKACAEKFRTDIAISITGIAGPSGGSKEKPVGLVYIAIDYKGETKTFKNMFGGSREVIRTRAAQTALFCLFKILSE